MANNRRRTPRKRKEQSRRRIDVLPDDVLLEIFDFYIKMYSSSAFGDKTEAETWQSLVHVCRRWRSLVLRSPHGLNLQLYCTPKTPAKETLDVWPALPLIVRGDMTLSGTDNVIAALGHSNRVCQVFLGGLVDWQLEQVLVAMQVSFPELTDLRFISDGRTLLFIPDSFLDGSAPRLRHFSLSGVPFPGLPRLLLSATHLVSLWLENTPHSGYISPEAIVTLLSVLSGLEDLSLEFRSPQSCPDLEIRRPLSSERYVVPALHYFHFKGVIEYLEDLVTGIDTPQLDRMEIIFFNQINFDTLRLARFIHRTPKLTKRDALVQFNDRFASVRLPPGLSTLEITILCREPDWQLSSVEQVCNSSLHPLSTVEDLYIEHQYSQLVWKNDAIDNTQWLQLLLPFTAVKNLYLSKEFAPGIAAALQELVSGRILEVLPSLKNIFVKKLEPSGPFQKNIRRFVTARQLSDHPITTSKTDDAVSARLEEDLLEHNLPRLLLTSFLQILPRSNPFSPPSSITHHITLCLTRPHILPVSSLASNVLCLLALILEIEPLDRDDTLCPEEGEIRPRCARRSCTLSTELSDRATLNALIEDLRTCKHHGYCARFEPDCSAIL